MNNEVSVTILDAAPPGQDKAEYVLIGPKETDRLPVLEHLCVTETDLDGLFDSENARFVEWLRRPDNSDNRESLRRRLKQVGTKVLGSDIPNLFELGQQVGDRRIWVYTDSNASQLPIEAAYSEAQAEGGRLGFLSANKKVRISFVRHLGLDPLCSLPVAKNQPLRMLVVFSNPAPGAGAAGNLGNVCADHDVIVLKGTLKEEREAIERALGTLCRLNLLEIHFLIGDDVSNSVFAGRVESDPDHRSAFVWRIEAAREVEQHGGLADDIIDELAGEKAFHVWHYFGHGVVQADSPALVTVPGGYLSSVRLEANMQKSPPIVILNACDSALPAAPGGGSAALTGFATVLLMRGTAALICMLKQVTPDTATQVTKEAYGQLAGSLFTNPMDIEDALHRLRQGVNSTGNPRLDFFCPVLFRRRVDGPLFDYEDQRCRDWERAKNRSLTLRPGALWKIWKWSRKGTLPTKTNR